MLFSRSPEAKFVVGDAASNSLLTVARSAFIYPLEVVSVHVCFFSRLFLEFRTGNWTTVQFDKTNILTGAHFFSVADLEKFGRKDLENESCCCCRESPVLTAYSLVG